MPWWECCLTKSPAPIQIPLPDEPPVVKKLGFTDIDSKVNSNGNEILNLSIASPTVKSQVSPNSPTHVGLPGLHSVSPINTSRNSSFESPKEVANPELEAQIDSLLVEIRMAETILGTHVRRNMRFMIADEYISGLFVRASSLSWNWPKEITQEYSDDALAHLNALKSLNYDFSKCHYEDLDEHNEPTTRSKKNLPRSGQKARTMKHKLNIAKVRKVEEVAPQALYVADSPMNAGAGAQMVITIDSPPHKRAENQRV